MIATSEMTGAGLMGDVAAEVRGMVARVWDSVWAAEEQVGFVHWCEKNVVITPRENADYAGPYRSEMVPSVGRFWEEFLDGGGGERWQELYGAKGSQSAFTFHALAAMVRRAQYAPTNVVYAIQSAVEAGNISVRYVDMVREAPGLQAAVLAAADDDLKGLKVTLPGMQAWFVGAGSAGALASKPGVGLVIADEVDKHKVLRNEAHTLDLLRQRGKATTSRKMAGFSTPTVEDGQIWAVVESGSGHRDFVPCPKCGFYQPLRMDQVRYLHLRDKFGELDLERIRKEAHYECAGCGEAIEERQKAAMLQDGVVRPTNYEERKDKDDKDGKVEMVPGWVPGRMSVYHNDLYALWDGSGWGDLAVEKIEAGRDPMKLRNFVNGRLGEAWKEGSARRVSVEMVMGMRGEHVRGTVPERPVLVACLADTQDDCWKAVVLAYTPRGDVMVSDWGIFLAWKEVVAFAKRGVEWQGKRRPARIALVDEGGHRTFEVRQKCAKLYPIFHPSKGKGGVQVTHTTQWRNYRLNKEDGDDGEQVRVLTYDDDGFRWHLYRNMILGRAKAEEGDPWLVFPKDMDQEFAAELANEHRVKLGGKWVWKTFGPNDFGDAVKMGLIAWAVFGHMVRGREGEK